MDVRGVRATPRQLVRAFDEHNGRGRVRLNVPAHAGILVYICSYLYEVSFPNTNKHTHTHPMEPIVSATGATCAE